MVISGKLFVSRHYRRDCIMCRGVLQAKSNLALFIGDDLILPIAYRQPEVVTYL